MKGRVDMHPADYENRLIAFLIDLAIVFFFALSTTIFTNYLNEFSYTFLVFVDAFQVLYYVYFLAYFFITQLLFKSGIGGLFFNVKIVRRDWTRLSLIQTMLRALLLSLFPLLFVNIGYMLLKRTQRTIYDVVLNTTAVERK